MLSPFELTEENSKKMAVIDDIMYNYKFGELTRAKRECAALEVYNLLLAEVKNSGVKSVRRSLNIGKERDTWNIKIFPLRLFEAFWLGYFHEVFIKVLLDYGKKTDVATGRPIPFTRLFWSYWKEITSHKKTQDTIENGEEIKWRDGTSKIILKYLAKEKSVSHYRLPERVTSRNRFLKEVLKLGVTEFEAEQYANFVFSGNHFSSVNTNKDDEDENEGFSGYSWKKSREYEPEETGEEIIEEDILGKNSEELPDSPFGAGNKTTSTVNNYQNDDTEEFDLRSFYDYLMKDKTISLLDKKWIEYYFTLKIIETDAILVDKYAVMMKRDLAELLLEKGKKMSGKGWQTSVLAEYCNLQHDTVRKKLSYISRLMIKKRSEYLNKMH